MNSEDSVPAYIPINKGQFTLEPKEREEAFERNRGFGVEAAYAENRRQWTDNAKGRILADFPLHVDIELSSVCNLKCPMCYTVTEEFKEKVNQKLMDFNLFKKIVDECAAGGVYSIRLSLRGEPMLHKRFLDCVVYAKRKGIKEVSTLTNGIKLNEEMFIELMEAGMDWITISFDGLGETYEKIRRPGKFLRELEKIKAYSRIKKEWGRVKPVIKVQSIFPAIEADPVAFYNTFAPITDMVSSNPLIGGYMGDTSKLPKEESFQCPQIYQRLVIGADGLVMMCSNDEAGTSIIGDMNTQSVHEVWHGQKMTKIREIHSRCKGAKEISACANCYLPLKTFAQEVPIAGHSVQADKYVGGPEVLSEVYQKEHKTYQA